MTLLVQVLFGGLTVSGAYFLIAAGINIVFGQTSVVNFAHGQFVVIAGLVSWELVSNGIPFPIAVLFSVVLVSIIAWVLELSILRRVAANPLASFLLTLGLLIILTELTVWRFGTYPRQLPTPISGNWIVYGVHIPLANLLVIGLTVASGLGLFIALTKTRVGYVVRATAEDALAGSHVGINVARVNSVTFVVGSALAAWAGCLLALLYPLTSLSGGVYLIKGFAVALVGGLGSISGGAVAALILGMSEQLAQAYWRPELVPGLSVALILIVLLIRPSGLFGSVEESEQGAKGVWSRIDSFPPVVKIGAVFIAFVGFLLPILDLGFGTQSLLNFSLVFAVIAFSVGFLFRLTGILSFGHGAFFGLGAYAAALASTHLELGFWSSLPLGGATGFFGALLVGFAVLRTRGFHFVIVTFAIADLFALLVLSFESITNGSDGITVIESPSPILGLAFESPSEMYRLFLAFILLLLSCGALVDRSRFGQRLVAMRNNETLARSLGLPAFTYKLLAFAFSGLIAGVGGVLFLYQNLAVAPVLFSGFATVGFPLMVILGGSRVLPGPVVGAIVLTLLPSWLDLGPRGTQLAYGLALVAIMLLMPQGLAVGFTRIISSIQRGIGLLRARLLSSGSKVDAKGID